MKRYDFRVKDGIPGLYVVEDGDYYFVADVNATMIPRPDELRAKLAVNAVIDAARSDQISYMCDHPDSGKYERRKAITEEARAAVLALMGVENA